MSVSVKEAYESVKTNLPNNLIICGCTDIGDRFVFSTNPKCMDEIAPGGISYQVMKSNGKVDYYHDVPDSDMKDPYANIRKLINGKEVQLPE